MPRVAAEGGDGLCAGLGQDCVDPLHSDVQRHFFIGVEPVGRAFLECHGEYLPRLAEGRDHFFVQAVFLIGHANISPAVHRQAVDLGEGL